jgi:Mg-chelatase subunit ChlD
VSFLAPSAFFLGLLLPVIVAMYLLKLRRVEQTVPSVYLWRRMVRDVEANAPWQRLRRNLLLLLQLLFLLALILALARPFTWAQGRGGQSTILILDASASMEATDVAPTRLEAAKAQARQMVDDLPDLARVTVIAAGEEARVLLASSQDRRQAHLALDSIQAESGGSQLGVALELASAIAARQPDTEVMVFSDGRVDLPERMALKGHLTFVPMGTGGNNQAISLLTVETSPGGAGLTAFVQVTNYSENPAQRRLALYADGQLANAYDLQLPASGQQAVLAEDLPAQTRLVEARLDGEDLLSSDDRALAVYRSQRPLQVSLVSSGNLFLQKAVELLPGLELTAVDPEKGEAFPPADLTIFDGYVPLTATLPTGSLLFIAPPSSTEYFTTTGLVNAPQLRPVRADEPLLQHVSLAEVNVLDAVRIQLPDWARVIVAGDLPEQASVPLLLLGEPGGRRVAVLAFDLHHSDLPLQVAFPILWANLIHWLAPASQGALPGQVAAGETLAFSLPSQVETVAITRPDGSALQVQAQDGQVVFADTRQLGLYHAKWGEDGQADFAVNLFSPQESDLKPAAALPNLEVSGGQASGGELQARREWWRVLALLALGLLTGEWMVYQRAGLVRLRDEIRRYLT